ncbi:dihydroorotase [Fructilactobacillus fructivorans]|uniref:Dihydroorotase n=1 Tax=Fructilactobacillus fructivorans TaxID=1614 RepID=A0A0C1LZS3_9LACO|nr:dihydroorotase [Fructilactobacillus fructivorans]KID42375.1 Dihydroorotase [Fructilactobacillus fructivorans]MCT0151008.1 dihydroorotase [Fructilactobacillus fructivorans]MCT2867434.1 dihydroorotase [Fructilactobacillus fructivorans]MCT2869047.1 dihydroorotase [Fructilactobacillus fructivorans]MCT2873233.1 dihydroorotase [Fructilactobacillus fructivorans]
MKTLIQAGMIFQDSEFQTRDILLNDGIIAQIGPHIDPTQADQIIAASGQTVLPGLVDVHVHFRDPGQTDKETVKTGSEASAHGGYTTVCAMPNVTPVPNTPDKLKQMINYNDEQGVISVKQFAPVTYDECGYQLVDFDGMKKAGAVAFSNDGVGIQTAKTMYDAMTAIAKTGLPLAAHVEDHALMNGGVMNEGSASNKLGLRGAPEVAETSQLARDLELARVTGVHYHVCHVSTARSVELIRRAKADGVNVTAEVTPHHLLLDHSMIQADDPMYKMNPPLRTRKDRAELLAGLLDGTIDMIATDHAPHTSADKGHSFNDAAFGITGIETAFPLLYTQLVKTKKVTLSQLLKWMSSAPTAKFNLSNENEIKIGNHANFSVWDLNDPHQIATKNMKSKSHNSPFLGDQVDAKNLMTFANGKLVYQDQ